MAHCKEPMPPSKENYFFRTAATGDLINLRKSLEKDITLINSLDEDGRTAFHWACAEGEFDAATFLFEKGADVTIQDEEGWSALHSACAAGHLKIVEFLLPQLQKVDVRTLRGQTALHFAALRGHRDILKFLLNMAVSLLDIEDSYGRTALMNACSADHYDLAHDLIDAGASLQAKEAHTQKNLLHLMSDKSVESKELDPKLKVLCKRIYSECPALAEERNSESKKPAEIAHPELQEVLL